ncbi:winged helix-turn-helix transcriptional regulator [Candidatus Gottesmanbacteria bacterium]|nr:winged helix-turn-helix transcriptional regulator [Candidatus Gottesmanbacteria bacterium]
MDKEEKIILDFLENLGLSNFEAKIYLYLVEHGSSTTLEISKFIEIPRTTVYRLLERLKRLGIVEEVVDQYKTKAKAVDIDRLEKLVAKKSTEVKKLQELFPDIARVLALKSLQNQNQTKVLYYRGQEGMKQMLWNLLRTKDLFRGYSYCTPVETAGPEYALEWALEFNKRGLSGRDLYSDQYLESAKKNPYPTPITWDTWKSRYVSPKVLNIDHQIDIYNDVVAYYNWHEGEIFGVEIYNQKVANLQKQIFDVLWKMGERKNF